MDIMNSIASSAMRMNAAQIGQQYAISVQKKAMDVEEMALQELQAMLPPSAASAASPYTLDVRA